MALVKILLKPRIHITLIDMSLTGYRKNGGIGFSIDHPNIIITAKTSTHLSITDNRQQPHSRQENIRLLDVLEEEIQKNNFDNIAISIDGIVPTHFGFGTTTSIRIGSLEALYILNNHKYDVNALISKSKRGGTSGIGINTYLNGGFVFDLGVSNNGALLPSSHTENRAELPKIFSSLNTIPWPVGICIPKHIMPKTEYEELEFFKNTCPIEPSDVYETLYHSIYGVYASIIEKDYVAFCSSINNIQQTRWKSAERSLYGDSLLHLEKTIYESGADAVGMSSLGPTLFFFGNDLNKIINNLNSSTVECDFFVSKVPCKGREILNV